MTSADTLELSVPRLRSITDAVLDARRRGCRVVLVLASGPSPRHHLVLVGVNCEPEVRPLDPEDADAG